MKKYKGWITQYAAMYSYTVGGHRHEVRGAAFFNELADVPINATGIEVRYLPEEPTDAIAHDERIQHQFNDAHTIPSVVTDCSK